MTEKIINKGIRNTLLGIFIFIFLIMLAFLNKINTEYILTHEELMDKGAFLLDTPRKFSGFDLVGHDGQPFTIRNLQGKWTLLFFGFTHLSRYLSNYHGYGSQFLRFLIR
jgi:protein SCO1/2